MPIKQSIQPTSEPTLEALPLAQVKQWLREDGDDQDQIILELIKSAREYCEDETGRAVTSQTFVQVMDSFPVFAGNDISSGYPSMPTPIVGNSNLWPLAPSVVAIHLMRSPVISVTSLKYYDTAGTIQTMDPTDYIVDTRSAPARITPGVGKYWPATGYRAPSVEITFVAGSATAAAVPYKVKQAMRMLVAHWYEHRESVSDMNLRDVPQSVQGLLDKARVEGDWW